MADNKSNGLLGGLIIGTAIGAIAGILAAPRTGRETRRILKKSADALPELAEDLATSIQFQADRLSLTSLSNWDQTLDRLREAIAAGQAASRREWAKEQSMPMNGPINSPKNTPINPDTDGNAVHTVRDEA
ncbi:MAG: YtxH domain-containing protein [Phormidesmis sp. RL_2_1]|nr:YtxH domain-containing protein [Phormidesmis sp. RL_2_1]